MKSLSKLLLLSLVVTSASYSMDKMGNNVGKTKSQEDLYLQGYMALLSKPIEDFVNDFQTWPKEEQDKVKTYNLAYGRRGYVINGQPAAADKYNGNIELYLDSHLTEKQVGPFLTIIDYVKQQKR